MRVQAIVQYLGWLCEFLDDQNGEKRIYHILMDIYQVDTAELVRRQARFLGFNVHFIPSGMTGKYQPLYCSIFGCMKSTARVEYLKLVRDVDINKINHRIPNPRCFAIILGSQYMAWLRV
jgi:hypothetical protein